MPILSSVDALRRKLETLNKSLLQELCIALSISAIGSAAETRIRLLNSGVGHKDVDNFIKAKFHQTIIQERENLIPTSDLKDELQRVKTFSWGVVQGQLDAKIQREFVRRYPRYNELVAAVKKSLYSDVESYTICSWYNHWTTVLIEEQISAHSEIIPTLKKVKGVDLFFKNQPFDLKITYLPAGYDFSDVQRNPKQLIVWLYENQGEQRFGADNRFFVILFDPRQPEDSWKLKRESQLIEAKINEFFTREQVTQDDEIIFRYKGNTYSSISKLLFILPD